MKLDDLYFAPPNADNAFKAMQFNGAESIAENTPLRKWLLDLCLGEQGDVGISSDNSCLTVGLPRNREVLTIYVGDWLKESGRDVEVIPDSVFKEAYKPYLPTLDDLPSALPRFGAKVELDPNSPEYWAEKVENFSLLMKVKQREMGPLKMDHQSLLAGLADTLTNPEDEDQFIKIAIFAMCLQEVGGFNVGQLLKADQHDYQQESDPNATIVDLGLDKD